MNEQTISGEIGAMAAHKVKTRKIMQGVGFGLGMIGLVGWSAVVPTLLCSALGNWLDKHHPGKHLWTPALLVIGLAIGCLYAWLWIVKEHKAMPDDTVGFNE
jgi:ATP synthase protein I